MSFLTLCLLAHQNIRMFKNRGLDPSAKNEPSDTICHRVFKIPVGEKLLLTLGFLAMALIGLFCYHWLEQIEFKDEALVIAHRGASMTAPENTLSTPTNPSFWKLADHHIPNLPRHTESHRGNTVTSGGSRSFPVDETGKRKIHVPYHVF